MSAFSGLIAVGVMMATFYFIRRHRLRMLGARGGLTEALLRGEVCVFISPFIRVTKRVTCSS